MSTMTYKLLPSLVITAGKELFSATTFDECFSPTLAVVFGSKGVTQAGAAQLHTLQGQLTSIPGAVISIIPIEPRERGIKHGDHVNGATVVLRHRRQWGWNRLHLLEVNGDGVASGVMYSRICQGAAAGARTWTASPLNCSTIWGKDACCPTRLLHMWPDLRWLGK